MLPSAFRSRRWEKNALRLLGNDHVVLVSKIQDELSVLRSAEPELPVNDAPVRIASGWRPSRAKAWLGPSPPTLSPRWGRESPG
jgi:hypothetical protein